MRLPDNVMQERRRLCTGFCSAAHLLSLGGKVRTSLCTKTLRMLELCGANVVILYKCVPARRHLKTREAGTAMSEARQPCFENSCHKASLFHHAADATYAFYGEASAAPALAPCQSLTPAMFGTHWHQDGTADEARDVTFEL